MFCSREVIIKEKNPETDEILLPRVLLKSFGRRNKKSREFRSKRYFTPKLGGMCCCQILTRVGVGTKREREVADTEEPGALVRESGRRSFSGAADQTKWRPADEVV